MEKNTEKATSNLERAKKNILKPSITLDNWTKIKGYNFDGKFSFKKFMESYLTTGFQATHFKIAVDIIKKMRKDKAVIFLGFTSNIISAGTRETICYLAKNKLVDVLVTTAGGIEEDIIKTLKPFVLGKFEVDDNYLRDNGVNRIGNIFVPNDRYVEFERFMRAFLTRIYAMQTEKKDEDKNKIISSKNFVYEIGRELELQNNPLKEESVCYWCYKNNIPYFCPALTDGSLGDMIYFFKQQNPEFKVDVTDDIVAITNIALNAEKTGVISLGGSLPKHHICNANMFREGADYAVYITTAHEGDGSNAGAPPKEAVAWGKIKNTVNSIKVEGDATILFPLIVAGAFLDEI